MLKAVIRRYQCRECDDGTERSSGMSRSEIAISPRNSDEDREEVVVEGPGHRLRERRTKDISEIYLTYICESVARV